MRAGFHTASRPKGAFAPVRPKALSPGTGHVGLNSARNFSSSRPVFQNIVNNAPLGLRILGDVDQLDVCRLKRDMKAAYLQKLHLKTGEKGKGCSFGLDKFATSPSEMDQYFSVGQDHHALATVQLFLTVNPVSELTPFLSHNDDAEQSTFFSAMLMSDLRLVSEIHGKHRARLRNLIQRLERAGCFEYNTRIGQANATAEYDEVQERINITFYGERWGLADVKQVLGYYDGPVWFALVDLTRPGWHGLEHSSSIPSDLERSLSRSSSSALVPPNPAQLEDFEDLQEYDRVTQSMYFPAMATHSSSMNSYIRGVKDFIQGLHTDRKPTFNRAE